MTASEENIRSSAAVTYLTEEGARKARPNLTAADQCSWPRRSASKARAVGGDIRIGDQPVTIKARPDHHRQKAAINTPAGLMRSGVADEKLSSSAFPWTHVPGVGKHLLEHPRHRHQHVPEARCALSANRPASHAGAFPLFVKSRVVARLPQFIIGCAGAHGLARGRRWPLGAFYLWISKSYSEGEITLRSTDPTQSPLIDFGLLSDRRDHERAEDCVPHHRRSCCSILSLTPCATKVFPTIFSDRVGLSSRAPTAWNAFQTAVFAKILDTTGIARSAHQDLHRTDRYQEVARERRRARPVPA